MNGKKGELTSGYASLNEPALCPSVIWVGRVGMME